MRLLALPVALVLLAVLAPAGAAQNDCLDQVQFPPVGRWAEYKALYNKKDPYTVRYAVVGTEKRGGKTLDWVELRLTGQKADNNMIYQMLVPGSLLEMGKVEEVVFKPGDKPAMKMNGMMMKMIRGQMEKQNFYSEVCKDMTLVGKEKITVPAGEFQTLHFHSAKHNSDSWLSPTATFALIKSVGENHHMELAAQGSGAKSSITEQPREMPGMGN
jgi:hypothetical protein